MLLFRGGNKELKNYNSQTPFQVSGLLTPEPPRAHKCVCVSVRRGGGVRSCASSVCRLRLGPAWGRDVCLQLGPISVLLFSPAAFPLDQTHGYGIEAPAGLLGRAVQARRLVPAQPWAVLALRPSLGTGS